MENKVRFIPHIVDYPYRLTNRVLTDEERELIDQSSKHMSAMMEKYNVHIVMNNCIYIPIYRDGVPIDKSMRVKVDGPIYNKIKEMYGGEFPRHIHIVDAERLDSDAIEPKF